MQLNLMARFSQSEHIITVEKRCKSCGGLIRGSHCVDQYNNPFCGRDCFDDYYNISHEQVKDRVCHACGKTLHDTVTDQDGHEFCDAMCARDYRGYKVVA